jgi:hypothetical protein
MDNVQNFDSYRSLNTGGWIMFRILIVIDLYELATQFVIIIINKVFVFTQRRRFNQNT